MGPLEKALETAIRDRERRTGTQVERSKTLAEMLEEVSAALKEECLGQYIARRTEFLHRGGRDAATISTETLVWFNTKWEDLQSRLELLPGKQVLKDLRTGISETYGVSLSDSRILAAFTIKDAPADMKALLAGLERFRTAPPP